MTFTAGWLLWGNVRFMLRSLQWAGEPIDWIEGPGWWERQFIVRWDGQFNDYEGAHKVFGQITNGLRQMQE